MYSFIYLSNNLLYIIIIAFCMCTERARRAGGATHIPAAAALARHADVGHAAGGAVARLRFYF